MGLEGLSWGTIYSPSKDVSISWGVRVGDVLSLRGRNVWSQGWGHFPLTSFRWREAQQTGLSFVELTLGRDRRDLRSMLVSVAKGSLVFLSYLSFLILMQVDKVEYLKVVSLSEDGIASLVDFDKPSEPREFHVESKGTIKELKEALNTTGHETFCHLIKVMGTEVIVGVKTLPSNEDTINGSLGFDDPVSMAGHLLCSFNK